MQTVGKVSAHILALSVASYRVFCDHSVGHKPGVKMSYDAEVKFLLGEGTYKALLKAVDEGKIDQTIAGLIAEQLHPTVIGNFHRQVSSDKGYVFSRTHFREILGLVHIQCI